MKELQFDDLVVLVYSCSNKPERGMVVQGKGFTTCKGFTTRSMERNQGSSVLYVKGQHDSKLSLQPTAFLDD